jgi:ADP-glucose pyrophosphorylase
MQRTLAIVIARCNRTSAGLTRRSQLHATRLADPIPSVAFEGRHNGTCAGTADALYRQLQVIEGLAPERVLVIESDAMRGIDYAALIDAHVATRIGATLAVAEVPVEAEGRFSDVAIDGLGRVLRLDDADAPPRAVKRGIQTRLVCAGAYVLDRELLVDCLEVDAAEPTSTRDFRRDVFPVLIRANGVAAYRAASSKSSNRLVQSREGRENDCDALGDGSLQNADQGQAAR